MKTHFVILFVFLFNRVYNLQIGKKNYSFIKKGFLKNDLAKNKNVKRLLKKNGMKLRCVLEGLEYSVRNLNDSVNFYKNVLQFRISKKEENAVFLTLEENPTYIKLLQNDKSDMHIGEHSFLGLGVQLKNFDIGKTNMFHGKVEEGIEKRPITACILPDEDAQTRRFWKNCFLLDPDGYGIEVVLEKDKNKFDRVRFFTTSTKDCQKFYSDLLGMELVKIQSHLEETSYPWNIFGGMSYFFSSPTNETNLQFAYAYDEDKLLFGNTFPKLIFRLKDLSKTEKKLKEHNIKLTQEGNVIYVKDCNGYDLILKQQTTELKNNKTE